MELIRKAAAKALEAAQLKAQMAMPYEPVSRVREAKVTVQVKRCAAQGRYAYLGMFETEGEPLELYGHQVKAELIGTAHTPADDGAAACVEIAAQVAECWMAGIEGMTVHSVQTDAPGYDAAMDCFTCQVCAEVAAWVYALPVDDGMYFEDFALKGTLTAWKGQEETG